MGACVRRGPQTPGELRSRAERMHPFNDLSEVQSSLQLLMKREPPLIKMLPRLPGTKESRYAHLLSGDVETWEQTPEPEPVAANGSSGDERIIRLEEEIARLRKEVGELKEQVGEVRRRFE